MKTSTPVLRDPSLLIEKAFIDGHWVSASDGQTFSIQDPATGQTIAHCPELSERETEHAIEAAYTAFQGLRATTGRSRAKILRQWHQLILANTEDLAMLITWESGKALVDAQAEVAYAASYIEWFAEEAPRIYGAIIPSSTATGRRIYASRQPVGVCALITPWNFPAAMVTRKIAPAIAAGCTVVLKSAGETPLTANALCELARRAEIPAGYINVITSLRNTVKIGQVLSLSTRIKKLSFTGSTAVGKILMGQCALSIKKLSLELGGNSPFIVFADCKDLDKAVQGAISAKFRGSGQTCVAANRILVQDAVYDTFIFKFIEEIKKFKVGCGFTEGVTHGPLIHSRAVDKVDAHVRDAIARGAKLEIGGERLSHLGENFYAPTILTGINKDMDLWCEETFGPVAAIAPFSTEEEAIEISNNLESQVGLAAYVFSSDVDRIMRVSDALDVGMVGANTGMISDAAAPFGGVKESGFGREGSKFGIEDYSVLKSVTLVV